MRIIKRFLILLFVTSLVIIAFLFLKTYLDIRKLEFIQTPIQFTKDFNPQNNKVVELKKCTDWHDFMYAWCVKSQYFPYKRLIIQNVIKDRGIHIKVVNGKEVDLTKPSAWILSDPFWKVFYVFYKTGSGSGEYYGPYKM